MKVENSDATPFASALRIARVILSLALCGVAGAAEWRTEKIGVRVVDDVGQPVGGAAIGMGVTGSGPKGIARGLSDTNGLFVARFTMVGSLYLRAEKPGYYRTSGELWDGPSSTQRAPPTNEYTVVLKKIINPVPLLRHDIEKSMPTGVTACGFDLERGDWVKPHGEGMRPDLLVTVEYRNPNDYHYHKVQVFEFEGPNSGVLPLPKPSDGPMSVCSILPVSQTAPLGGYARSLRLEQSRSESRGIVDNTDEHKNYIFQVRVETNDTGSVVHANVGWVDNGFNLSGPRATIRFRYYYNPDPISRSLEPSKF